MDTGLTRRSIRVDSVSTLDSAPYRLSSHVQKVPYYKQGVCILRMLAGFCMAVRAINRQRQAVGPDLLQTIYTGVTPNPLFSLAIRRIPSESVHSHNFQHTANETARSSAANGTNHDRAFDPSLLSVSPCPEWTRLRNVLHCKSHSETQSPVLGWLRVVTVRRPAVEGPRLKWDRQRLLVWVYQGQSIIESFNLNLKVHLPMAFGWFGWLLVVDGCWWSGGRRLSR